MSHEIQVYVLPLFAAAFGMLALTAPAWRTRREPIVAAFIATCLLSSLWPLAVGLELVIPSMAWKVPLARVLPVLITMSASAFALLILQFTGQLAAYQRQVRWVLARVWQGSWSWRRRRRIWRCSITDSRYPVKRRTA
jgi:N-terminal 7TM region of histidine kinase